LKLNYTALIEDKLIEAGQVDKLAIITNIMISCGTSDKLCHYHGLVDPQNQLPTGIGLAIDESGNIYEGQITNRIDQGSMIGFDFPYV